MFISFCSALGEAEGLPVSELAELLMAQHPHSSPRRGSRAGLETVEMTLPRERRCTLILLDDTRFVRLVRQRGDELEDELAHAVAMRDAAIDPSELRVEELDSPVGRFDTLFWVPGHALGRGRCSI